MEFRQLEYFVAVAAEMNFTRAAQRVHVVQSALSTAVSKLEKELGVELFDRSRQKIRITPAGELFRDHARQVIDAVRLAKDSVSDYRGQLSGTIEFGFLVSCGRLDLPKVLGEFHRDYPFVRIRLQQSQSHVGLTAYLSAIADGALDLALVSAPDVFPPRIEMRLLSEEPLLFVCRPDHHLAGRNGVTVAEIADEDLIGWPPEFGLRRVVEDAFTAAGLTPRVLYELEADFSTAADLIRHGLGSMFMPASEANRFPDLLAVPIQPAPIWPIYLAQAEHAQRPASAKLAERILASTRPPTGR
ncbi:MAG: LysR family transcriptional regulator [Mycobacterium sp.]|nr:LysR family transcriptional regulator [Mycobacterium sp.]